MDHPDTEHNTHHLAPNDIAEEAMKLARAKRALPSNVFERRFLGRMPWPDMQFREQYLTSTVEYIDGNTDQFYDAMPGEEQERQNNTTNDEHRNKPGRMTVPKARRWLDIWASTYNDEPRRTYFRTVKGTKTRLDSDDKIVAKLNERYQQAEMNSVMADIDFGMREVGNMVARPWFDQDHNELIVHTYLSQNVRVIENADNIKRPHATVIVGHEIKRAHDAHASAVKIPVAEIWTPDEVVRWNADQGVIMRDELLTKRPPLVHCFESRPTTRTGYYVRGPGAQLAAINAILDNDYFTQFGYTLIMQGIGVAVAHGFEGDLVIGPNRILSFPGNPDVNESFEFVQPNAPLGEWTEAIQFLADEIRNAFGIPSSMIDVTTSASGAAIVQANGPMIEIRNARQKQFRRIETDMLRATIDVLTNHDSEFPNNLDPDDFDVSVDYGDTQASFGVADRVNLDNHFIELGILTPGEILMRERPDEFDTVEKADAFIALRKGIAAPGEIVVEPDAPVASAKPNEIDKLDGEVLPTFTPKESTPETKELAKKAIVDVVDGGDEPAKLALNGAQITALQGMVEGVALKELPFDSAVELILAGFPDIPKEQVLRMLNPAKTFKPSNEEVTNND